MGNLITCTRMGEVEVFEVKFPHLNVIFYCNVGFGWQGPVLPHLATKGLAAAMLSPPHVAKKLDATPDAPGRPEDLHFYARCKAI